jgi:outer membrane lipoprotein LolB
MLNNAITFGEVTISSINNTNNSKINNKVRLTYDGKEYLANNPEELLLKLTGLKLPISELQYWILGLPSPSSNYTNFNLNQYATLETLTQAGFNISYENYGLYNSYTLPTKVTLKTPGLRIKIQIEDWKI